MLMCDAGVGSRCWFVLTNLFLEGGVKTWCWGSFWKPVGALTSAEAWRPGISRRVTMPRDRPRMGSRRGGIQGRAPPRDDYHSPSSSIEVTSRPRWFQDRNDEEGRYMVSSPIAEERQRELPTIRYRLPCPQINSTLIVSITVEPGDNENMEVDPLPEGHRSSREDSPIACPPVGAEIGLPLPERDPEQERMEPRRAHGKGLGCPDTNLDLNAGPSMHAAASPPGPSMLARKSNPDQIIQLSDSETSLHFGYRIVEARQNTDED